MPATDWSAARALSSSTTRSCTALSRSSTTLSVSALLRKNRKRKKQRHRKESDQLFQAASDSHRHAHVRRPESEFPPQASTSR
jgi:hypothetical protein